MKSAWRVALLLFLFMLINFADKAAFGLAATQIMAEFGLSHSTFGLLGSSFFLLFAVSGIAVGFAANRVSSKWLLAGMAAVWSCAQVLPVVTPGLTAFLASRILLGAGEGPAAPIAQHALYKWFDDSQRTLPTGIVSIGVPLGAALAAPLLAFVIAWYGWRVAFGLLAGAGLMWVVSWLMLGSEGQIEGSCGREPFAEDHIAYRRLLLSRTIGGALLAGFGAYWCLTLALLWMPPYLTDGAGYTQLSAGWIVALPFLAMAVVMPASGWLSQALHHRGMSTRTSRGGLVGFGTAGSGIAMLAMAVLPAGPLHIVALTAAFSLCSAVLVIGPPLVAEISPPQQRAATLGVAVALATSAGLLAPVVMGRIVDAATNPAAGYATGFGVTGVLTTVAGALALVLIEPQRDRERLRVRRAAPIC